MRVLSLQIGRPRDVDWNGKKVSTGIFKDSVSHPVRVGAMNLEGDGQADLAVHGGEHKAVYSYAAEHYAWWKSELGVSELPYGVFGENLTIEGMDEDRCFVGDRFRIGTAILEASQPRLPCFKLGIRFNDPSIVKRFLESGRLGIYYRVEEGVIEPGSSVEKIFEHPSRIAVSQAYWLTKMPDPDLERVRALLTIPTLCPKLQKKLQVIADSCAKSHS